MHSTFFAEVRTAGFGSVILRSYSPVAHPFGQIHGQEPFSIGATLSLTTQPRSPPHSKSTPRQSLCGDPSPEELSGNHPTGGGSGQEIQICFCFLCNTAFLVCSLQAGNRSLVLPSLHSFGPLSTLISSHSSQRALWPRIRRRIFLYWNKEAQTPSTKSKIPSPSPLALEKAGKLVTC